MNLLTTEIAQKSINPLGFVLMHLWVWFPMI